MLVDWTEKYVQSRDAAYKNIEKIEKKGNSFVVTNISTSIGSGFKKQVVAKIITYFPIGELVLEILKEVPSDSVLVVFNTQKNLSILSKNFDEFAKNQTLKIIFVNLTTNDSWQIVPYRHLSLSKMVGGDIKTGLLSLFETVPEYLG
ncbi:MAG: hypothetical protein WC755_04885 [Candidatus Woesearchaeota archaeon]|jgi:hypothetical protein